MKKYLLTVFLVFFTSCILFAKAIPDSLDVLVPRAHNPAFVEPGGAFEVEIRGAAKIPAAKFTAILKNDLKSWPVVVKSAKYGRIHHDTEDGWKLTITVPANVPPELMELEIRQRSGIVGRSIRSVSVVPNFETDFYMLQQSDQHLTTDLAVEPGGKSSTKWGNGSKQALTWLTSIVNLINPRFLLHTGDNMQLYNEADNWCGIDEAKRRVKRFINGLSGYTIPTVVVTGNHDIGFKNYVLNEEWREEYENVMGQKAFSFHMGSFYVLATEWTNTEFLNWARADYRASWSDPSVKYRLLAAHYYDGLAGSTTVAGSDEHPCDLLLVGHNHITKTLQEIPYYVLSAGTAQNYQRAAFFDFKHTNTGWTTSQPASHADNINVHKLVGDNGAPTVSIVYGSANEGTAKSNTAAVTNNLPHDFYNGRIRFLMPKGKYTATGGTILVQYDYAEGKKTAVDVRVNIRANAVSTVSVSAK